jgi:Transposase
MQTLPTSKNLDHLGLVSGMCDRLEISSEIDRLLPNVNGLHQVSTGTCVKALILNGLGFSERRLYLTPKFLRISQSLIFWVKA